MKANVKRGSGFRGILLYALDRGNHCAVVGGNMSGRPPKQLSREFGISRRLRTEVKRPGYCWRNRWAAWQRLFLREIWLLL